MYIISGSKATRVREEESKEEVAGKRNIRGRVKARNVLPQNNRRGVSLPTVTRHHARRPGPLNYLRKYGLYKILFPFNAHNIACEKESIVSSVIYQRKTPRAEVFRAKHLWNTPILRYPSDNLVVCISRRDTNSPRENRGWSSSSSGALPQARFCQLPMQPKVTTLCTLLAFVVVVAISSLTADAIPHRGRKFWRFLSIFLSRVILIVHYARSHESYWDQQDDIDRDEFLEILSRLSRTVMRPEMENTKRGLDLGLSRGFSGSQAAKHLMGLAAANYAGGPGRRRRSEQA
ncbi:Diuretic hormone class 2 [Cyphomyrmex costatus]|uniref:Diuretic hormone class 2 n=1 Tax=Cyphomyrmex costatus TaxID=456900 RepID=A0A195CNW4_9HYME|nr:Diuretic hormone class 2 [Cyphomyrmex costatus]